MTLYALNPSAVKKLKIHVKDHIKYYESGNFEELELSFSKFYKDIDIEPIMNMNPSLSEDPTNVTKVYECLGNLTPREATLPGLWMRLTHFECYDYVNKRWKLKGDDTEEHYSTRFCSPTTRSLHARNGISRLWWIGHLCRKQSEINSDISEDKAIEYITKPQHIQSILERPDVTRDINVFAAVIRYLERNQGQPANAIEPWAVKLNILVNGLALNAFEKKEIDKLFDELLI